LKRQKFNPENQIKTVTMSIGTVLILDDFKIYLKSQGL